MSNQDLGYTAGVAHCAAGGGMPAAGAYRADQTTYYEAFRAGYMAESKNRIEGWPTPPWLASRRHLDVARSMVTVEVEHDA